MLVNDERSNRAPAIAGFGDQLLVAWTGQTAPNSLYLISFDGNDFYNKSILAEQAFGGPALAFDIWRDLVWVAWTGHDVTRSLYIATTADGVNLQDKYRFDRDASSTEPRLTAYGGVYIAWTGRDPAHSINAWSSPDGKLWDPKAKHTLPEQSMENAGPAILSTDWIYWAWAGRDDHHSLNVGRSDTSGVISTKRALWDQCIFTPGLCFDEYSIVVVWEGIDDEGHINSLRTYDKGLTWQDKRTYRDCATAGVSVANWGGVPYVAWAGTDAAHSLNIAKLSDLRPN